MKKLLLIILFVIALHPPSGAVAEDITFAVGNFPPHHYKENGQIKGAYIEIITEISARLGLSPKFVMYPWKRALWTVKKGDVDGIVSVYFTEERDAFLYYATESLGYLNISIFSGKENDLEIRTFADLKNTSLFQIRGTSYGPEFDSQSKVFKEIWYCNNIEKQIELLNKKPLNVAIANEAAFITTSDRMGLNDRFKRLYIVKKEPLFIAFSKAIGEKGQRYAEKFSLTLKQLKKEGVLSKIEEKYLKHVTGN